jgi:hypothetical protein
LTSGEINLEEIYSLLDEKLDIPYEIFNQPINTKVKYHSGEIRIMCPKETEWKAQQGTSYYIGFKAYAPKNATRFKQDLAEFISNNEMHSFADASVAGVDEAGRKYSIIYLPVANYIEGEWTYFGAKSTVSKYIGWHYSVEWYDDTALVASDTIRINLSNEECHNYVEPYYMGSIDVNKLTQKEGDFLIFYGGSATENI